MRNLQLQVYYYIIVFMFMFTTLETVTSCLRTVKVEHIQLQRAGSTYEICYANTVVEPKYSNNAG